eukprot:363330-Chlamydomonas_euryale.AAC.6
MDERMMSALRAADGKDSRMAELLEWDRAQASYWGGTVHRQAIGVGPCTGERCPWRPHFLPACRPH